MHRKRLAGHSQRGSSFTSCLLTVIVVFGGLGFYYFKYFQWRHFDDPTAGLTYNEGVEGPQLNEFRKSAVANTIDPVTRELDRLVKIRKKTKGGKESYSEMEQELTEVRNRLRELLADARLRRIPKKFSKNYNVALLSMKDAFDSVNYLEEAFSKGDAEADERLFKESVKKTNDARKKLNTARDYFHGDGWKN